MAKNYTYPRVDVSTTALTHSSSRPQAEDTLILFAPFLSDRGPTDTIVKIHSLEEFRSVYGLDSTRMERTLLNISNWLVAGGTVYAFRLSNKGTKAWFAEAKIEYKPATDSEGSYFVPGNGNSTISVDAKYVGNVDYGVEITKEANSSYINVIVRNSSNRALERFKVALDKNIDVSSTGKSIDVSSISEYLSKITFNFSGVTDKQIKEAQIKKISGKLAYGTDGYALNTAGTGEALTLEGQALYPALRKFWGITARAEGDTFITASDLLGNELEYPIEVILDACYPSDIKDAMINFVHTDKLDEDNSGIRTDVRCIIDAVKFDSSANKFVDVEGFEESEYKAASMSNRNLSSTEWAAYAQRYTISEETYFDRSMEVGASYFLSQLLPANDLANGIQFPVAGKRRAVLEGVISLSKNPLPDEKEAWFQARLNYAEKDSRGIYFMSQRTHDGSSEDEYTALSFLNNSMTLCRIVHEIKRLGRNYLFEFNDSVTLSNLSSVLNKYITNWIANRALSYGNVIVSRDEYSDERVNVQLNIKFNGSIEVISVDIIIE